MKPKSRQGPNLACLPYRGGPGTLTNYGELLYSSIVFFVKKQTDRLRNSELVVSEMVASWYRVKNTKEKGEKNTFETK